MAFCAGHPFDSPANIGYRSDRWASMARMNLRLPDSGRSQMNRISTVLLSSPRTSIDHMLRVNSSPSSGCRNSQATACIPSEMKTSRKARGSLTSRLRSRST